MKAYHCGLCPTNELKILLLITLVLSNAFMFQGCGTLSNGRGWGQDATLFPGWERIERSAVDAALSPETWAPLAAALALQINDMDERISDWASENNPVFGSRGNAGKWSNYLRDSSAGVYFITAMAAPGGDDASDWLAAKAKGLAVGLTAVGISSATTSALKKASERTRPDGADNRSFPSGHSTNAGAYTTLARLNLDSIPLSRTSRTLASIGITGLAVGTGWARVEAKVHYPSDVLAGYALGHYFSAFINNAFLGLENDKAPRLTIAASRKCLWLGLTWSPR